MATRRRWALPLLASLLVLLVVGALVSLPSKAGAASQVMEPPAEAYAAAVAPACAPADTYPEIALDSNKGTVQDLASDGDTIWVLQETSTDIDTLSAYNLSTGARDTDQDINPQGVSNLEPQGVWIDATTLYMPDDGSGDSPHSVRAFNRSDGKVDPTGFLGHPQGQVRTLSENRPLGGGDLDAAGPQPWAQCLRGDLAAGFSLVVFEGGSVEELVACAESRSVTGVYALADGEWVSYILGAPDFANRDFVELYPDGLPPFTPMVAQSAELTVGGGG